MFLTHCEFLKQNVRIEKTNVFASEVILTLVTKRIFECAGFCMLCYKQYCANIKLFSSLLFCVEVAEKLEVSSADI